MDRLEAEKHDTLCNYDNPDPEYRFCDCKENNPLDKWSQPHPPNWDPTGEREL